MKRSFLYLTALAASLLLIQGCTQEDVPVTKPLLTENDQARLRELAEAGFKPGPTETEFQSFNKSFTNLTGPELDYFNQLVTDRSIALAKKVLPAAEQEPAIKTLELVTRQKKQLNAYAVQTFGKTYLHLSEDQFMQAARQVGLSWETETKVALPTARTTANPGCPTVWNCNVYLTYSSSGSADGHQPSFVPAVYDSYYDVQLCNYGFETSCSLLNDHIYVTATDAYARSMFTSPRPAGFGGLPGSSQTTGGTRRLLLSKARVDYWGFLPTNLATLLRIWLLNSSGGGGGSPS